MEDNRKIIKILDASPSKQILLNKALNCPFENSAKEIIDNCIDYWEELIEFDDKDLNILFEVINTESEEDALVRISWNMGIPEERWEPLVKMGAPQHKKPETIGVWGEGFKIAIFGIGTKIDIYSKLNENVVDIDIPENWLKKEDWNINVFHETKKKLEEDTTVIEIKNIIKNKLKKNFNLSSLQEELGLTYGTLIKKYAAEGKKISIQLKDKQGLKNIEPKSFGLPEDLEENYAYPPGLEPTEHIFQEYNLDIRMVIGLLPFADSSKAGVYLYGNNRLFERSRKDDYVGFGLRENSPIPAMHPHGQRLQVHIFFTGMPQLIPWAAPLKDGLNIKSAVTTRIAEWVREHGEPYVKFVQKTKKAEILPYSAAWKKLSEEKKKENFFEQDLKNEKITKASPEAKAYMDKNWKEVPEMIKKGIDVKGKIDIWDHTVNTNAPEKKIKYNLSRVKEFGKVSQGLRDEGKITTIDVANKLLENAGVTIASSAKVSQVLKEAEGEVEHEVLSVRLPKNTYNELKFSTGKITKSELLNHIIEIYLKLQKLKELPKLKKIKSNWTDEQIIEKLKEIVQNEDKRK